MTSSSMSIGFASLLAAHYARLACTGNAEMQIRVWENYVALKFLRNSFSLAPVTLTYPAKASSRLVCQLSAHATQI